VVDAEALDHALGRLVGDELGDRLLAHAAGEISPLERSRIGCASSR
jgi:hypothetical protein